MSVIGSDPAKPQVLAAVAALSGIATPAQFGDSSGTLAAPNQRQQIVQPNPQRNWIVIYNPSNNPLIVSTGNADFSGDPKAMLLGPGNALFWAQDQGGGPVYQGAMTAIGYLAKQPFFVFEAPTEGAGLDFSKPSNSGWLGQVGP